MTNFDLTDHDLTNFDLTDHDLTDFDLTDPDLTYLDSTDSDPTDHVLMHMDAHVSTIRTTRIVRDPARLITDLSTNLDNPN